MSRVIKFPRLVSHPYIVESTPPEIPAPLEEVITGETDEGLELSPEELAAMAELEKWAAETAAEKENLPAGDAPPAAGPVPAELAALAQEAAAQVEQAKREYAQIQSDTAALLAGSREEAAKITAAAENIRAEAEQMLANARQVMSETEAEAVRIKEDAYRQGFEAGKSAGFAAGKEEAAAFIDQARRILEDARREREQILKDSERDIIGLALGIATKIIHQHIAADHPVVLAVTQEAMKKVTEQCQLRLRVNPGDYELVAGARQELRRITGRDVTLDVIADLSIGRGGCVIDSECGSIDARIDTQLEAVKRALTDVVS